LVTLVGALPSRAATTNLPPIRSIVNVTGFNTTSLSDASSGPVTVQLDHRQLLELRSVLAALPIGQDGLCMEDPMLFEIEARPTRESHPTYKAWGGQCPESVQVSVDGVGLIPQLSDTDCSLLRFVVRLLPAGKANATRHAVTYCPR
jgi:hypothetical protein